MTTTGMLSVLNVGAGDIEVRFNPHQPEELDRAVRMLQDMQRRGYAILVKQDDGSYVRAEGIDPTRAVYIISGEPAAVLAPAVVTEAEGEIVPPPRRRGRPPKRTQPIETSHAVGIGRSAGG